MADVMPGQKNDNNDDCYFCRFLVSCRLKMRCIAISYSSCSTFARYITQHFSFRLIALLLCTGCNDTDLFFSSISRSRNKAFTL